jgi:hypothetical protein
VLGRNSRKEENRMYGSREEKANNTNSFIHRDNKFAFKEK